MPALYDKKGGVRKNSGRPRGGVRDARRRIMEAVYSDGADSCAQVVSDLILNGEGLAVIKLWVEMTAHIPQEGKERKKKKSVYVESLDRSHQVGASPDGTLDMFSPSTEA